MSNMTLRRAMLISFVLLCVFLICNGQRETRPSRRSNRDSKTGVVGRARQQADRQQTREERRKNRNGSTEQKRKREAHVNFQKRLLRRRRGQSFTAEDLPNKIVELESKPKETIEEILMKEELKKLKEVIRKYEYYARQTFIGQKERRTMANLPDEAETREKLETLKSKCAMIRRQRRQADATKTRGLQSTSISAGHTHRAELDLTKTRNLGSHVPELPEEKKNKKSTKTGLPKNLSPKKWKKKRRRLSGNCTIGEDGPEHI